MTENKTIVAGVVAVLLVGGLFVVSNKPITVNVNPSDVSVAPPSVVVNPSDVSVTNPTSEPSFGAVPGPYITQKLELQGGVKYGNVYSTSSPSAVTLSQRDLDGWDTILVQPKNNATWTFPASTTLASWLPKAGDTQRTCIHNDGSTYTLTLAQGTGITFLSATGTNPFVIEAGNAACLTFTRETSTSTAFRIRAVIQKFMAD